MEGAQATLEGRVLVLTMGGESVMLVAPILARAGIEHALCPNLDGLARAVIAGAGAILMDQSVLADHGAPALRQLIAEQPPWSDLPVLLLAAAGMQFPIDPMLETLGNVIVLERPVRGAALLGAARTALRARKRQYQTRSYLGQLEHAAAAARESEACFRLATQAGAMATWDANRESGETIWSENHFPMFGYEPVQNGRASHMLWRRCLHPDDLERVMAEVRRAAEQQTTYATEYRIRRANDGAVRWISATGIFFRDAANNTIRGTGVLFDCTERRQMLDDLRRSEADLADFFENATLGLHWVGADGIVLRANRAELELLGYARDEYIGHHIAEFHDSRDAIDDILARLCGGETVHGYEARLRCKDGSLKDVVISSSALWEDGKFIHSRCFTQDVTERKRMEQTLRETDRRKDEFLATLAHELRNPLAPIRNAVELLRRRGPLDGDLVACRDLIERQVGQLGRLVDDLIDVSRVTRGKVELRRRRVALAEVIASAVETSQPLIQAAGHTLRQRVPQAPIYLDADAARLAQVFSNLLNNAAKYTPLPGLIALDVAREGGFAVVRVMDSGIGIPQSMLRQVFDMFVQVDLALERAQGGLGIGLTLVRLFTELHGGAVQASSNGPGTGSEFIIRLPIIEGERNMELEVKPLQQATLNIETAVSGDAARRILIVDDNQDAADSLAALLGLMGNDVHIAYDGAQALEMVVAVEPQIVLMDIGLPKINGYDAARQMRGIAALPQPLLVALTGWGQVEDRRRSREAGFDHHLVKPVALDDLQAILTRAERQEN